MPSPDRDDALAAMAGRYGEFYSQYTELKPLGGELRGPCPLHGGQGANFAVNPDKGLWNCFAGCQDGGDIFRFLEKKSGLTFPEALAEVAVFAGVDASASIRGPRPSPKLSPSLPQEPLFLDTSIADGLHKNLMESDKVQRWLLDRRGFTPETLIRLKIGLLPAETKGAEWRICFPIFDRQGKLTSIRKHLFAYKPDLTDERRRELGKTLPWMRGLTAGLYPIRDLDEATEALIVEGEADAALATQMGFAAVTGTGGAGTWHERWTEELQGLSRVTILYDADGPGEKGALKTASALAAAIADVRIARLPEGEDLTSWVVERGATIADVQQAIDAAIPFVKEPADPPLSVSAGASAAAEAKPASSSPKSVSHTRKPIAQRIVDLADVQPPIDLPLLFGQYLLKGAAHWLTGQTGLGKSTLLFNIACALAEGTSLWDIECTSTRILYVDAESGDVGRAHKIERLYRDAPRVRGQLLFLREPIKLPEELPELLAFVQEQGIELVIFDTARRCFSVKDENDNAEVYNRVIPTLDALKLAGVATLTMGHPSKNGNGSARGAGAQEDAGDVNLSLTMHRGEVSDPDGVIALRVTKNRLLGLGVPPLFLKRIGDDQFERSDAGDAAPVEEPLSKQLQCRSIILDALDAAGRPLTHGELLEAAKEAGFSKPTFGRAFSRMKDENDVSASAEGYLRADPFA
ncbi:MAG: AAA family ATPase [Janthinobacterium lividum]